MEVICTALALTLALGVVVPVSDASASDAEPTHVVDQGDHLSIVPSTSYLIES
ncbi:MAG: hypothetical protein F6K16_41255 [Symploca sp. SIO2B6]|nr:hypothetical protein [Symploca sp. SIO2B6]